MGFIKRLIGKLFGMVDEDDYEALEKKHEELKATTDDLINQVAGLADEVKAKEELVKEVSNTLTEVQTKAEALEEENVSLKAEVKTSSKTINELTVKVAELEADLAAAENSETINKLENEVADLKAQNEDLKSKLSVKEQELAAAKEAEKAALDAVEIYSAKVTDLMSQVEAKEKALAEKEVELANAQSEALQFSNRIAQLEAEIKRLQDLLGSGEDSPTPETVTVTVEENPEVDVLLNGEVKTGVNEYEKGISLVIEGRAKDPAKQEFVVLNVSEDTSSSINVAPQVEEASVEEKPAKKKRSRKK